MTQDDDTILLQGLVSPAFLGKTAIPKIFFSRH
jgi:hypothetical protein